MNADKRSRYSATLQRTSGGLCGGHVSSQRPGDSFDEDIKSKENERLKGIKNNFSRLVSYYISAMLIKKIMAMIKPKYGLFWQFLIFQSQEVTYAEFTMPRNKGYAPMRAKSGCDSPSRLPVCKEGRVYYSAVPQQADKIIEDVDTNTDDQDEINSINIASLKHKNHKLPKNKPRPPAPPPRYTSPPTSGR